jgi:hypothetical protein
MLPTGWGGRPKASLAEGDLAGQVVRPVGKGYGRAAVDHFGVEGGVVEGGGQEVTDGSAVLKAVSQIMSTTATIRSTA